MDEVIKTWSTDTSRYSYSHLGQAIKSCDWSLLKEHNESILQQLSCDIKDNVSSSQLTATVSCIQLLLERIITEKGTVPILTKLIKSLLTHQLSSITCQCIILEFISLIMVVCPGQFVTESQLQLKKWSKEGLFSDNSHLVKVSACLLRTLFGSHFKQKTDDKHFLSTIAFSINYCLDDLSIKTTPTRERRDPASLLLPDDLSLRKGKDREEYLVKCVGGLSRLAETCLLLDDDEILDVPLNDLWSVIWRLMEEEKLPSHRKIIFTKVSWQLLLAIIHSCGTSLLSYSHIIEAAIVKTLQQTPPIFITGLVCKCVNEWVWLRGIAPSQFIEDVTVCLCIIVHNLLESCQDYQIKQMLCSGINDLLSLYMKTLYTLCCNGHIFSPVIIKFLNVLCERIISYKYCTADINELSRVIVTYLMEYPHNNDILKMDENLMKNKGKNMSFDIPLPAVTNNRPLPIATNNRPLPVTDINKSHSSSIKVIEQEVEEKMEQEEVVVTQIESSLHCTSNNNNNNKQKILKDKETRGIISDNRLTSDDILDEPLTVSEGSDSELDIDALLLESFEPN